MSSQPPCNLTQISNYQVFQPYPNGNGMLDNNGEWKYCLMSRFNDCLDFCIENLNNGNGDSCVGITTHEAQSRLVFPVSNISEYESILGQELWYWPCLVEGEEGGDPFEFLREEEEHVTTVTEPLSNFVVAATTSSTITRSTTLPSAETTNPDKLDQTNTIERKDIY